MIKTEDFAVIYQQSVAWGDMDAFAHVNNVMYYRYIESARIKYFNQLNLLSYPVNTVVSSSQCRYLKPVFYPDTLYIGAKIVELRNSAFRMEYQLFSENQNAVVALAEAVVVFVDKAEGKKTQIPSDVKAAIIQLEKTVNNFLE